MGNGSSKRQHEVALSDFDLLQTIGKGSFGKVRIAQKRDTKQLYALKAIDKEECIGMHAIQNVFRERAILEDLSHPFICNLNYAFQDDRSLYFVLDLFTGGDLRLHLNRQKGFPEAAVRVWALELASAIQYLHSQNVVHRDLKPDNILLDMAGHIHLTDFNISVSIDKSSILKSQSGTLPYMAPEVFDDQGYYWQVDWWGFGITLYELIYYKRPFRGKKSNTLIANIREAELVFPTINAHVVGHSGTVSSACVAFLTELLDRNPFTRLGCRARQIWDVRQHAWLSSLDWRQVERGAVASLYVPDADINNFDPRINLEEFLMDGFPVQVPARKSKKRPAGPTNSPPKDAKVPEAKANKNSSRSSRSLSSHLKSRGSSDRKQRSASDAAAMAGNVYQMMRQYKTKKANGYSIFGIEYDDKPLTEEERKELELRFMTDHFLAYDSRQNPKRSKSANHDDAPPMPAIPASIANMSFPNHEFPRFDESLLSSNRIRVDDPLHSTSTRGGLIQPSQFEQRRGQWRGTLLQFPTSDPLSQFDSRHLQNGGLSDSDSDSDCELDRGRGLSSSDASLSMFLDLKANGQTKPAENVGAIGLGRPYRVTTVPLPADEE
ncbi:kinase-like domain-containing protein [Chytriomyces sp. MP71]|nr:kinase-like domain-containing protein [Chytriomyces sp. MP71]